MDRLDDYHLLEIDGNIVGTVAVHFYREENVAEVACLFVKRDHEHRGHGKRLVRFAEKKAKEMGASEVIALSTQAANFFAQVAGFQEGSPKSLPEPRKSTVDAQGRNPRVFTKAI